MKDTVLENFLSLCAIPHKSGHEEALSRWLYRWALEPGPGRPGGTRPVT